MIKLVAKFKPIYLTTGLLTYLATILVYWNGAEQQLLLVNNNMESGDQSAYMYYASDMHNSNYKVVGGRNRMPVYPFLQSLFYEKGMSDEEFFLEGKYRNLILSVALLTAIGLIFIQFFSIGHALLMTLITAFTVFMFKAGYFQTELLFYFLNFVCFLFFWHLLRVTDDWRAAVLTGVVVGITHLTKASILPGLMLFLVVFLARLSVMRWSNHHLGWRMWIVPLIVAGFFLLTVWPYISTSKERFGHYFYNVNSTFYMWYDSWEEAKQGTRAHGDRKGWPALPEDKIPSFGRYVQTHTPQHIVDRIRKGSETLVRNSWNAYGYANYVALYGGAFLLGMGLFWRRTLAWLRSRPSLAIFLLSYFGIYWVLYAWYTPIASGVRLPLAQFLPLLCVLSWGVRYLWQPVRYQFGKWHFTGQTAINLLVLTYFAFDLYSIIVAPRTIAMVYHIN